MGTISGEGIFLEERKAITEKEKASITRGGA